MSQNSCCVPGCPVIREHGVPLHKFPNPDTNSEKFKTWISNIGGEIAVLDYITIYNNRRVCDHHFQDVHKYPNHRLSKLAVPVQHIPDLQPQILGETVAISTSDVQAQPIGEAEPNIVANSEQQIKAIVTEPNLPSSCNVSKMQSNIGVSEQHEFAQDMPPSDQTQDHVEKHSGHKKKKTINSKGPRVTFAQHKEFKAVLKKLRKCERKKTSLKAKYNMAKRCTKTEAFNIVSKNMSHTAKLFCQMQVSQSGKKKQGKRFTLDEKILALSLQAIP